MPRVSREQMTVNRAAVVRAAAALLREHGPAGVTVDAVSARAGLTHGGFYKQFASKEALLLEALQEAREQRQKVMRERADVPGGDSLAAFADAYLSPKHRDNTADGCVAAALLGTVAREPGGPLGDGYSSVLEDLVDAVATRTPDAEPQLVLMDVALLIGALQLARATAENPRSEDFLTAAREHFERRPTSNLDTDAPARNVRG